MKNTINKFTVKLPSKFTVKLPLYPIKTCSLCNKTYKAERLSNYLFNFDTRKHNDGQPECRICGMISDPKIYGHIHCLNFCSKECDNYFMEHKKLKALIPSTDLSVITEYPGTWIAFKEENK